jgi:hypothetical protein
VLTLLISNCIELKLTGQILTYHLGLQLRT